MSKIHIKSQLMLLVALVGFCTQSRAQIYFKEYIDSDENCDEFNTQVIARKDSIYLINFISCDPPLYHTNILHYNSKGEYIKELIIDELVPNVHSGHVVDESLFLAGVNNDEKPNSKLVLWNGELGLNHVNVSKIELVDSSTEVYLNTMGSIGIDSNKIIYGQYSIENNPKVFSFLLWLNPDLSRDSLMIFDSSYVWSVISDAKVDSNNNLYILSDAAKVFDHIVYNYRILLKYNSKKQKVFEWVSAPFGVNDGIPSFTLIDSATYVLEFVAEENGNIHSLIAINQESEMIWEHIFHIDDPKSLYRINDIITSKDGSILCCGIYRNISENTIETGYVCKLDRDGNLLWERVFYDQEELLLPESGINKVIHFSSIVEAPDNSIVIGGRVIHNFLSLDSKNDVLLIVLDSSGCISSGCSVFNDITKLDEFLNIDKVWTEVYYGPGGTYSYKYRTDSIPFEFDGNIYYQLQRASSEFSNDWSNTQSWLREDHGRIYEYGIGNNQILYDYNLVVGDTFHMGNEFEIYDLLVEVVDSVSLLNGDLKKRWLLRPLNPIDSIDNLIWIEGIGNLNGLLTNFRPWSTDWDRSSILCVYWMNSIIYDDPEVDSCWLMSTSTKDILDDQLRIVPNPASDEISIIGLSQGIESIKVFDAFGRLYFTGKEDKILVEEFPVGYYFLFVRLDNSEWFSIGFVKM